MAYTHSVDLALIVLRCVVGGVFLAHGFNHVFGGGKIAGTARWFEGLGMRPGRLHAWTASLTEIGAGALLALGLLTPLACAGVIGVMFVAWITNHRGNGFFTFRPGEGWEYVMVLTVLGAVIATVGPGGWSLDSAIGITALVGWTGLLIALAAGGGGALLLLACCWRPAHGSIMSATVEPRLKRIETRRARRHPSSKETAAASTAAAVRVCDKHPAPFEAAVEAMGTPSHRSY